MNKTIFEQTGFLVIPDLLDRTELAALEAHVEQIEKDCVGIRHLLEYSWCADVARRLRRLPQLQALLPRAAVAVQCTYFEKSTDQNWLVPLHQDLSIPVKEKIDHPALTGWSEKEGSVFVQAPADILSQLLAVRIHIDDCGPDDGPLRIVPGSHQSGRVDNVQALADRDRSGEIVCTLAKGGALLMRPLVLHASSKASGGSKRRVLHFVFGPRELPCGLRWRHAVC